MIKVLELFGGIGACSKALTNLGIEHEIVDLVEIDKYAVKSFNAVHGTNFEPQDITTWDKDIKVDLIMHGSPCQDFSVAGRQAGGDKDSGTRSSLMYETLRIVDKLKPKYVIWENVKNLLSKKHRHNFDAYLVAMEKLGYNNYYQVLNAKHYGVPQNRERVFTVSIRNDGEFDSYFLFPEPVPLEKKLKDMLEKEVDEKYYLSDKAVTGYLLHSSRHKKCGNGFKFEPTNGDVVAHTVSTKAGQRPTDNFVKIITANKTGYDLATDGDGVDLAYPKSTTRRGRVGHGVSKTITTSDNMGVIVDDMYKSREPRIYGETAPTLRSERTGLKVVVGDNKKPIKETPSIIQKQGDRGTNNYSVNSETSYTIPANPMSDRGQQVVEPDCRIRKLTETECWRLMGFDDEDINKAKAVGVSRTQLYKQAGNSIVVDVLMAIFRNLLDGQVS